jgi:hypothetical protein
VRLHRPARDDPAIASWLAAEDVHVGNLLETGDFLATYFAQYAFGEKGRYREGDHIVSSGHEEPRTPEMGHTISLGAAEFVRFRDDYYSYDRVFDHVHELGGITGFAHQGMSFRGYRGMALNVLRGKVDFLELAQFCVPEGPLAVDHYYHFLDLGLKLTALAGSDFPWCGRGPRYGFKNEVPQIGNARFYTYVGKDFSFERWYAAVKNGRTFVTTGPALLLRVNGRLPGETLDVAPGATLQISAEALGHPAQVPLSSLEIIMHAKAVRRITGRDAGRLSVEFTMPVGHGVWIAAKCEAGKSQVAHTIPVYVSVDGGGFHNPETTPRYLDLSESYLDELEKELSNPGNRVDNQAVRQKVQVQRQSLRRAGRCTACARKWRWLKPSCRGPETLPVGTKQSQTRMDLG